MSNLDDDPVMRAIQRWAEVSDAGDHEQALRIAEDAVRLAGGRPGPLLSAAEICLEATRRDIAGIPPTSAACTFCGDKESDSVRIVAGPHVFVCSGCIAACRETLREYERSQDEDDARWRSPEGFESVRCSFCARPRADAQTILAAVEGAICDECVATCATIMFGGGA